MNAIVDLSSEAVSYLTLIQDILKNRKTADKDSARNLLFWDDGSITLTRAECDGYKARIGELVWSSNGCLVTDDMIAWFSEVSNNLLKWLHQYIYKLKLEEGPVYLAESPFYWREIIRKILYTDMHSRPQLVSAIRYMPLQIVQILAQKPLNIYTQRLYQVFITGTDSSLFTEQDKRKLRKWWTLHEQPALTLILNDRQICEDLLALELPVPFETIFHKELDEIAAGREKRSADSGEQLPPDHKHNKSIPDPLLRAEKMDLSGLAFSGGGIRSATFNLGILQKLANLRILTNFDYLSTVSGGGYIGSWYAAWIREAGSAVKVSERLDPATSPQPHAEEVRPIRWLRMFSNYLAPDASIMSADTWTIGMTWLRNTLINQCILLLLLLTVLSAIDTAFTFWRYAAHFDFLGNPWYYSTPFLLAGGVLAAICMRSYDKERPPQSLVNLSMHNRVIFSLVFLGVAASIVAVTYFYYCPDSISFYEKFTRLLPCFVVSSIAMIGVAYFGKYHDCVKNTSKARWFWPALVLYSALAGLCFQFLLTAVWELVYLMKHCGTPTLHRYFSSLFEKKLVIITAPPLVLEAVSVSVVVRMALLGNLFPDERREWWGRLGALVHRFMLFWVLVSACALIVPVIFLRTLPLLNYSKILPYVFGSWAAVIGSAVKLAFSPSTGADKQSGGLNVKEIFIRVAPYLFMLGFLLLGAWILNFISDFQLYGNQWFCEHRRIGSVIITVTLGLITLFLGWRVGVNEFSLHHFYRNRLIRAYLGAARRRTNRESTANTFTGFDSKDDFPLSQLVTGGEVDYKGPYPLINATLNATTVTELDRQDRKGESFVFSPLYCGFDFSPIRSAAYTRNQVYDYAYRPTGEFSKDKGPSLGTTMAISGAAVNPNMGYHSSTATAFLLTMFNVRLGWWLGNPRRSNWKRSDPKLGLTYLVNDLVAKSDISNDYVCLSDGGHFDNMGLYELIRRRCNYIVLCDAEEDQQSVCEGLANAIRRCFIDFGVEIKLNVDCILNKNKETGYAQSHLAQGTIEYPCYRDEKGEIKQQTGTIIYIKSALTNNTTVDIREYAKGNPEFPNQSTGDQFFDESQFESYRKLGYNSIENPEELGLEVMPEAQSSGTKPGPAALAAAVRQGLVKSITVKKLKIPKLSLLTLSASADDYFSDALQVIVFDDKNQIRFQGSYKTNFHAEMRLKAGTYIMQLSGYAEHALKVSFAGYSSVNPALKPSYQGKIAESYVFTVV